MGSGADTRRLEFVVAPDAAALEAWLTERAAARRDAVRTDPERLAAPWRVLVPTRALRLHAAEVLARSGAHAGVVVQTLRGAALEVLERAGLPAPLGEGLVELLALRAARDEPTLARALGPLDDAWGACAATLRDLFAAGFEAAHAEALLEGIGTLEGLAATPAERARAAALVRAAAAVERERERLGVQGSASAFRAAARLVEAGGVEADGAAALPSDGLVLYAFDEPRGVEADLVEALARTDGAALAVVAPADPLRPDGPRLQPPVLARFEGLPRTELDAGAPPPELEWLAAVGAEAEARVALERARAALSDGAAPERVALVAPRLEPLRAPLRVHAGRLGIPASAVGAAGPWTPAGRRAAALLAVLREGGAAPCDRLVDALAGGTDARRHDLRLGLRALGIARARDLATLAVDDVLDAAGDLPLPARGARRAAAEDDDGARDADGDEPPEQAVELERRKLAGDTLRAARDAAAAAVDLADAPRPAPARDHAARTRALATDALGWGADDAARIALDAACDAAARGVPDAFALDAEEWAHLLARAVEAEGREALAGEGGGVRLLEVGEATAQRFDRLVLCGLVRGAFPQSLREDPLLPDTLRDGLRALLPDLAPRRARGERDRRALGALLDAAPRVTLLASAFDEDGREVPPSPLVAAAARARGLGAPTPVPGPSSRAFEAAGPRPAGEHLRAAALAGRGKAHPELLALALREAAPELSETRAADLASARVDALDELDPPPADARRRTLGPFLGFAGRAGERDLRNAPLYVTTLEGVAACGWRTFLERVLRLEPTPDPFEGLPGVDARALGILVHEVLEVLGREAAGERRGDLADALQRAPGALPRPDDAALDALLAREAERVARAEGLRLPGLVGVLVATARAPLVHALRLDAGAPVVGVEVEGAVRLADGAGREREVRFRADRVDRTPDGARLTDYKTGRPLSSGKKPETRAKHALAAVARGARLQGAAYALGAAQAGVDPEHALGRYLALADDPRVVEDARDDALSAADVEGVLRGTAAPLLDAWRDGAFGPRLVDDALAATPRACGWCAVSAACVQGDSGLRARLADRVRAAREGSVDEPGDAAGVAASWFAAFEVAGRRPE